MNIQYCENIKYYLHLCGVDNIDSLTKEQLFA